MSFLIPVEYVKRKPDGPTRAYNKAAREDVRLGRLPEVTKKEIAEVERLRPRTRSECHEVRRSIVSHLPEGDLHRVHAPCPFASCRYHLGVDVEADGSIAFYPNAPIEWSCVLDFIDARAAIDDDRAAPGTTEAEPPVNAEDEAPFAWLQDAPELASRSGGALAGRQETVSREDLASALNVSDESLRLLERVALRKMRGALADESSEA
jgi:hypothetical protein